MTKSVGLNRRQWLVGTGGVLSGLGAGIARGLAGASDVDMNAGLNFGQPAPFSLDRIEAEARKLASAAFRKSEIVRPDILDAIDYDSYQQLRYRPELSLDLEPERRFPIQFFHLGKYFKEPVRMFFVEGDAAREVLYQSSLFDSPEGHIARGLPPGAGFAGFRVMAPDRKTDWLAALGASYFRTSGPFNQYGLSARGLAIDTGLASGEEFPRFTHYYLESPPKPQSPLVVTALLDSPSVSGAYRMAWERLTDARGIHRIEVKIEARLFARVNVKRLGIAPFSSMFWYGKHSGRKGPDWRPQIHDSDGVAIWTGSGERIFRPLNNPPRVTTNAFVDKDVRGFGLLQRDRDFVHYLDDGVFYERRPSVWVEPMDAWGPGAVHLLEIPTDDETHDNIAAYWCPDEPFKAGDARTYRYKLSWLDDIPFPEDLGRATDTFTGEGGIPGLERPKGVRKFVIDWHSPVFRGLGRSDGVELVVSSSRGVISNIDSHPVVDQRERWRCLFDLTVDGKEPVDLRAYLKRGDRALSETWLFQHIPEG